jgi:hypothetical protein
MFNLLTFSLEMPPTLSALATKTNMESSVTTEANDYEPLDPAVLKKLRALQRAGAPDILRTLIFVFLDNGKTMLGNLEHAANAGDYEVAPRQPCADVRRREHRGEDFGKPL